MQDVTARFQKMTDADIGRLFNAWVRTERSSQAELLELLGEVDARQLYMQESAPSLFQWLREKFNFSEAGAYRRITVARKGRTFPGLIEAIRTGRLHLTGASLLAAHLNQDNCDDLLRKAERLSKTEIEEMLAIRFPGTLPRMPSHDCVKFMRGPVSHAVIGERQGSFLDDGAPVGVATDGARGGGAGEGDSGEDRSGDGEEAGENGDVWGVMGATAGNPAVRLCVTIDNDTYKTLVKLEELHPGESKGQLIGRALRLMQAKTDPELKNQRTLARMERQAEVAAFNEEPGEEPGEGRVERKRAAIPRSVQALVWSRDSGQCTFKDASGTRCSERRKLEYDHVVPVAAGGRDTFDNLRLRCRLHNRLAAIEAFGKAWMSQWAGQRARRN